jgi:hypothetical protein
VAGRQHAGRDLRCTAGLSLSSRMVLLIWGRERPIRVASSSWVQPKSSSSCW